MQKRNRQGVEETLSVQRVQIKKAYSDMKNVEGGDIALGLIRTRGHDIKTQLQWVAATLQREIFNLRGEVIKRQEIDDDRLDKEKINQKHLDALIESRKTLHAEKSWFSLLWEWIKNIPIGRRLPYEPENFGTSDIPDIHDTGLKRIHARVQTKDDSSSERLDDKVKRSSDILLDANENAGEDIIASEGDGRTHYETL